MFSKKLFLVEEHINDIMCENPGGHTPLLPSANAHDNHSTI